MKLLNSPFSLLPSQFLGMRSLIRHGLDSAGLPHSLLLSAAVSHLPLLVSTDAENVAKSAGVTMSARCCAAACATAAAAAAGAVLDLGVARAFPLVASLTDAPLPCLMQRECVGEMVKCT